MALSILDGNQTATTLATTVSGGAHFPNHIISSGTVTAQLNYVAGSAVGTDGGGHDLAAVRIGYNSDNSGEFAIVTENTGLPVQGTVTANVMGEYEGVSYQLPLLGVNDYQEDKIVVAAMVLDQNGKNVFSNQGWANSITISSLPAISGTVTVGNSVTIGSLPAISGTVTIGNTVTVSQSGSTTIGAMPSGALTTRFGSVTTANTAQISTAVTNTSRKYLLIQNVTTASNVITVGIGFTPTTTQGIQLAAGAGITFESSYIPTGAVYVLSSVTASSFTILEA